MNQKNWLFLQIFLSFLFKANEEVLLERPFLFALPFGRFSYKLSELDSRLSLNLAILKEFPQFAKESSPRPVRKSESVYRTK